MGLFIRSEHIHKELACLNLLSKFNYDSTPQIVELEALRILKIMNIDIDYFQQRKREDSLSEHFLCQSLRLKLSDCFEQDYKSL